MDNPNSKPEIGFLAADIWMETGYRWTSNGM